MKTKSVNGSWYNESDITTVEYAYEHIPHTREAFATRLVENWRRSKKNSKHYVIAVEHGPAVRRLMLYNYIREVVPGFELTTQTSVAHTYFWIVEEGARSRLKATFTLKP